MTYITDKDNYRQRLREQQTLKVSNLAFKLTVPYADGFLFFEDHYWHNDRLDVQARLGACVCSLHVIHVSGESSDELDIPQANSEIDATRNSAFCPPFSFLLYVASTFYLALWLFLPDL